jgi:tetratricopeptide (TPR) repeat protein
VSYAAVLLDTGDFDKAIGRLDAVVKQDPGNGMTWYLQSQAFLRKGSYSQAVDAGEQAVKLTPANAEAHLWLAEALRRNGQCDRATNEYQSYLSLSNFNSGSWNYYVVGSILGIGIRKQASQQDIWRALRAQAYIGICDCEWMDKHYDQAALRCQKALTLVPHEMFAEYRLGTVFMFQYNAIGGVELLREARLHFQNVIATNPDTEEGQRSKNYADQIDSLLAQTKQ